MTLTLRAAALHRHVGHIVGLSSGEEVAWLYATRNVAFMKNAYPRGDWAVLKRPRGAVCINALPLIELQDTVPKPRYRATPQQAAAIGFWNSMTLQFFRGGVPSGHLGPHVVKVGLDVIRARRIVAGRDPVVSPLAGGPSARPADASRRPSVPAVPGQDHRLRTSRQTARRRQPMCSWRGWSCCPPRALGGGREVKVGS